MTKSTDLGGSSTSGASITAKRMGYGAMPTCRPTGVGTAA